jgi:recombination protein RecA
MLPGLAFERRVAGCGWPSAGKFALPVASFLRYLFGMTALLAPALANPEITPALPDLTLLRDQLHAVVASGRQASGPWSTGLAQLDRALGGGIPRGRVTEISGPLAVGKTALLRKLVTQVLHTGAWVAWIDATRTLAPAPFTALGARFVVIRPPDRKRCAWTADLLLRSGVFALVVIDGAPPLSRVHGVRLAQLARERDAACVVLEHHDGGRDVRPSRLAGTVRLRIAAMPVCTPSLPPSMRVTSMRALSSRRRPTRSREPVAGESIAQQAIAGSSPTVADTSRRFVVTVEKGGNSQGRSPSIEVNSAVVVARRVCAHSEIPDRRGVARRARRPWSARSNSSDAEQPGQHTEHPVTWGGLGVSASDLYGVDLPGHPARLAAGFADSAIALSSDRPFPPRERGDRSGRSDRETDQRTRDWTRHRGRRRAADPSYARRPKRDLARAPI